MSLKNLLQCSTEPFRHDPAAVPFFPIASHTHLIGTLFDALQQGPPISILRGPNGAGKTQICLQVAEKLRLDTTKKVEFADAGWFASRDAMLAKLTDLLGIPPDENDRQDKIVLHLMQDVVPKTIPILVIDHLEAQPEFALALLQKLFSHHVNAKRLKIVLVVREKTFDQLKTHYPALFSTKNIFEIGGSLQLKEMSGLLNHHWKHSGAKTNFSTLFSDSSITAIYETTKGNPGRSLHLAKMVLLQLIIENLSQADKYLVYDCAKELFPDLAKTPYKRVPYFAAFFILLLVTTWSVKSFVLQGPLPAAPPSTTQQGEKAPVAVQSPPQTETKAQEDLLSGQKAAASQPDEPDEPARANELTAAKNDEPPEKAGASDETSSPEAIAESTDNEKATTATHPAESPLLTLEEVLKTKSLPEAMSSPEVDTLLPPATSSEEMPATAKADEISSPSFQTPQTQKTPRIAANTHKRKVRQQFDNGKPSSLGTITVFEQETLGDMIRRIYGPWSFTPENTEKVLEANRHIKNAHMISIGDVIDFPLIPVRLTHRAEEVYWVRLLTIHSLQDAYRFLRIYADKTTPLIIIPSWTEENKPRFHIFMEQFFNSKAEAAERIADFDLNVFENAEIIEGLSPDRYYYQKKRPGEKK